MSRENFINEYLGKKHPSLEFLIVENEATLNESIVNFDSIQLI